jgi:predicted permease
MNLLIQLLPAISVILFGIAARNMKIFNQEHIKGFEIFLFKIGMPCYLFSVTFNANLNEIVNIPFIIAYLVTFVIK